MSTRQHIAILSIVLTFQCLTGKAQKQKNLDSLILFPEQLSGKINSRIESLEDKIVSQTEKTLTRIQRSEQKLKRKLAKIDSLAAKELFANSAEQYDELLKKLQHPTLSISRRVGEYFPSFDSLKCSLDFLSKSPASYLKDPKLKESIDKTLSSVKGIQERLKSVSDIRKYLSQRRNFLQENLERFGLTKELKKISKEIYYYGEMAKEFKKSLNDPAKLEMIALQALKKIPAFNDFVSKNSFLASVFGDVPNFSANSNGSSIPTIPGLQTRAEVGSLVNTTIPTSGPNNQDVVNQQISQLKNSLKGFKSSSGQLDENSEMPNFKPNDMKTKSFMDHLEFGTNFQFGKTNSFLPSTADIAGQVAYKFHQSGSAGIGMSYKLGFNDIRRVSISHQGVGIRSFLDYKMKGSFFVNGGLEFNYNAAFKSIEQLKNIDVWQSSALIGASKKYKISNKLKGNFMLLYDFLHKAHLPYSRPFIFRFGYTF